jgi:hypothetical protein
MIAAYPNAEIDLLTLRRRRVAGEHMLFSGADTFEGQPSDPVTLHKYLYGASNAVNRNDPTGHFFAMVGSMLGFSATVLRFAVNPGRNFQASWGLGRELSRSFDYGGVDAFALADRHQASQELQLIDIISEAKRGFAATASASQLAWDAIFETFDLNEQILLDLVVSPFFASACFAADTPIIVGVNSDGTYRTKPIQDIHEGDSILARDERNVDADVRPRKVEAIFSRETDHLRTLKLRDAQGRKASIRTTDGHLIWADGRGWTKASSLEIGDRLCDASGAKSVIVESNEREVLAKPRRVYTFRVATDHTYFVSDGIGTGGLTVWVHNVCGGAAHLEDTLREERNVAGQTRAERRFFTPEGDAREADAIFTGPSGRAAGDSKYVENWSESIFNPNNPSIGHKKFAELARAKVVAQAKDYLRSGFKTVEYMSNSREFIATYSRMFEEAGIDMRRVTFTFRPQ